MPPFDEADLFDEAGYLRLYPGIAEAMMRGVIATAWEHYIQHGKAEGRQPNDVDPEFYLASYAALRDDLGREPSPADAAPHFILLGRARGYLPNRLASRPPNAATWSSPFGGFWTDQANALDQVRARLDLGRFRHKDAAMLRAFALDGIATLDHPFDKTQFAEAALVVSQAFTGMFPDLLFAAATQDALPENWRPELNERPVAALDPHMVSRAIRALLLDKAVIDFLTLLFDAPPKLTASQADLRLEAAPERDVARHAHTLPLQFVAVTFQLDDHEDGSFHVWPGSHRLPDLTWSGEHVNYAEARRAGAPDLARAQARRDDQVLGLLHGQPPRIGGSTIGTRTIRHANLVHAVHAPERPFQRRTVTGWYCPSYVAPCYAETAHARTFVQDGVPYASGVYPAMDPTD